MKTVAIIPATKGLCQNIKYYKIVSRNSIKAEEENDCKRYCQEYN